MLKKIIQNLLNKIFAYLHQYFPVGYWIAVGPSLNGAILEMWPRKKSPLDFRGTSVRLRSDGVIFPYMAAKSAWQVEDVGVICRELRPNIMYLALDVGANIGLFSRQLLIASSQVGRVFCFEPEEANFRMLSHNLGSFDERIKLHNAAITDTTGKRELFIDSDNVGNCSLSLTAMYASDHSSAIVQTVSAGDVEASILEAMGASRLIWKSDTQTCDLYIASLFSMHFWGFVDVALLELWRIKGPDFNEGRFVEIADTFSRKFLVSCPSRYLSSAEILEFVHGNDGRIEDLCMVK